MGMRLNTVVVAQWISPLDVGCSVFDVALRIIPLYEPPAHGPWHWQRTVREKERKSGEATQDDAYRWTCSLPGIPLRSVWPSKFQLFFIAEEISGAKRCTLTSG